MNYLVYRYCIYMFIYDIRRVTLLFCTGIHIIIRIGTILCVAYPKDLCRFVNNCVEKQNISFHFVYLMNPNKNKVLYRYLRKTIESCIRIAVYYIILFSVSFCIRVRVLLIVVCESSKKMKIITAVQKSLLVYIIHICIFRNIWKKTY